MAVKVRAVPKKRKKQSPVPDTLDATAGAEELFKEVTVVSCPTIAQQVWGWELLHISGGW